ncbi:hypothetical protein C8R42DRAFT_253566 [Lentinula raphanica]|nr:hypothetical protein C8R42DRAFT_253566 [Lentinula raphanica]
MTSLVPLPPLAERIDIHKSCKAFETLLSVFNDYCEAAGAVATLQKKMAKVLRETASMKVTGEIPANALNTTATIFEALSEVDQKFSKLVDKEYDGVSGDVKKWFKKLAKEEKAHDERIAIANAKIKQAGLMYEKKSKKSARDAGEEHARYINLISTLGPEISQEKHNHALEVTNKHTTATYNVAASVSRLADAEWLRACESVRRFAPSIGTLAEWRSYCEGGWIGPIPADLKETDHVLSSSPVDQDHPTPRIYDNEVAEIGLDGKLEALSFSNAPPTTDHAPDAPLSNTMSHDPKQEARPFPSPQPAQLQLHYQSRQNQNTHHSTPPSSFDPPRKFTDNDNTGSVRSLSQFPAPPTHFPLPPPLAQRHSSGPPPMVNSISLEADRERQFESISTGSEKASENNEVVPSSDRPVDKPASNESFVQNVDPMASSKQPIQSGQRLFATDDTPREPSASFTQSSSQQSHSTRSRENHTSDIKEEHDASVQSGQQVNRAGSNGSVVAVMRNRYSNTSGGTSPPPNDIPRLPLSVTDLAARYQAPDGPSSPRSRPLSPNGSRPLISLDTLRQGEVLKDRVSPSSSTANRPNAPEVFPVDDELQRHQQRPEHLAELELQGRERDLRLREHEIEMRRQELERERALLMSKNEARIAREPSELDSMARNPQPPLRLRDRQLSFQQPQRSTAHRMDTSSVPFSGRPLSQYSSASTTNLVPPGSPSYGSSNVASTSARRDSSQNSSTGISNHAPYCGCENCSAAKYKSSSPLASPVRMEKEKPKGWMRRLSMPIVAGNAFLDSKKNKDSGYGIGKGVKSLDSKKNASTTGLRTSITEEGRLGPVSGRSYDAGGIGNRSMTNLGMNARQ